MTSGLSSRIRQHAPGTEAPQLSRVMLTTMLKRPHRPFIVLVLMAWLLLGPIAMAFADCPAMMSMCEGPCGALTYVVYAPPRVTIPMAVTAVSPPATDTLPAVVVTALDPPPKLVSA